MAAIGVVGYAEPLGSLPVNLSRAARRGQAYAVRSNRYPDGASQRHRITTTSRKIWEFDFPLTAAGVTELREFFVAHHGRLIPFYFTDSFEGVEYVVRFDCDWAQLISRGTLRAAASVRMIELTADIFFDPNDFTWNPTNFIFE